MFCFVVRDQNGQALAYIYFEDEPGRLSAVKLNVKIQSDTFIDALDFLDLVRHDIRLSTAVLNSARFPIVSPSGALLRYENAERQSATPVGHVIDGGYFDNNGSLTTTEVASVVLRRIGGMRTSSGACPAISGRRVIFVEILNDPSLPYQDYIRSDAAFSTDVDRDPRTFSGLNVNLPARQLLTAVQGLETTRSAHAVYASKALAKFAASETCNETFVQFRVCPGLIPDPPLGWTLSRESRDSLDSLLLGLGETINKYQGQDKETYDRFMGCYRENQDKLGRVISLLQ